MSNQAGRFSSTRVLRAKNIWRKLEAHFNALRSSCQRLGIACKRVATDRALELALFDFLRERMQRTRGVKRFARQRR